MILAKSILFVNLILCLIFYQSNQKIISISLESDLIDSNSSNCLKGSQDYRSFIGYTLNSLLGVTTPGQYNYQAFSASIWFKPKYAQSDWSNNFGILSDITGKSKSLFNYLEYLIQQIARLFDNRNGFTLNNVNSLKIFSLQAGYFGTSQINKETQYYQSFYNKVWIKGIILYQPLNKIGYARVLDAQNNLLFETSMDFSNLQTYFMHYIPGTQNINNNVWLTFQHGVYYNYNSCSKQKYAMFHYSNDEAFSVSQIQVQAFDNYINYNINFPVSYFPLKRQVNNLINNQIISFQRYKNIYSPNLSEAINGQNYLQDGQDINFVLNNGEYIADFNSGQYVQYPTSLSPYQFMISYIFYYNQITANGITLFTTDTNSFTIQVIQTSQLQITLSGNPNKYAFNLAQNGTRHTIAFSVYGPKLLTKITYYQNNITVSSQKLSSLLNSFSKIYIGGQQQPNDRFQIQDLYLIPNSEFQVNYTTEPALVPKNCSFFYSFNLNLSNCFSCQANYQLNYYGQCVQVFQQSQIQQMPFTYSYFGSNFISIVDVPSDPTNKQLIYNYQISNNQFDFLILGYYQINQWQIGQLFTSLAYLQVLQTNQYYFLNIYLESLTKMTLKLTLDQANLICYQSIIYENSVLNQWILVGFGYKTSTLSAYLVYQDKYGITKYQMLSCSGQSVGADTNSFQVCIGCLIANNNKYSQFIGKVKNIKLIEGFSDYPNINQYIYFDQDAMDLSANNINYLKVYSLKDLFTYSLPGMQFACTNGYYFLEGICVSSCTNVIRSQTSLGSYSPLYTNNDTLSCEICPQNCLTCSSSSICTSCKPGFVVDQNSNLCISCSQNTFYDTISHLCVQKCTNIADLMNMQCVIQSDPSILNSFLFFSSQILTYNEGFQILDSNSILQQDTFSKCQGNNPYSFFMFYGGESVSSTQTIQKVWQNLPNNYSKQIKFTVVLFNFSSLADLQVLLNGQIASQTSMILINQNNNICIPNSQTQTQTIYQLSYDLTDNLNTLQLIIKYKQNGLGIRNIQLSVKKCHSSCNSCQNGPNPWNCITCQKNNNVINSSQCVCASSEYSQSNQCYSSPCLNCVQCSVQNCLRCQDETGDCIICNQGYSLLQGKCISSCSQQQNLSSYSVNSQISVCYLSKNLALDHFQNNKIINNLEFWQLSVDYVSQSGLINCLNQNFLPNLGNVNGVQDFIALQMPLNKFKSNYRGILFDINLVVIDNVTLNTDFIIFQFAGTEVKRVSYQGKSAPISTCINPNYQEQIQEILLPIYKPDGQIDLKIQSLFNDIKQNESFTLSEVKAYYIINEPLCTQYSFGQNYSSSQCSSCKTNSSMGLNNQCLCNDGYYFYYNPSNLDGECIQCNPVCSKCVGPSIYDCLVCSTNKYYSIFSKACVTQCLSNEFIFANSVLVQNECHQCDNSCLTCQGPNNTDCLTCKNSYYQDSVSKLCVAQCQSNQYQINNPSTGQIMCMPCDLTCLTCKNQGPDQCTACSQGKFLYSSYCLPACPNNYQTNQKTNTCDLCQKFIVPQCQACHITCKQCTYGKTDNNSCTSCYETKQLIDSQCKCKNTLDTRDQYFQCSYQNIAVLDIYLSSTDAILTIEFGSPLNTISNYNTPSSEFCNAIFDDKTQLLIGATSTCIISGSQILVNLGNDSTVMENNELTLRGNVLSFKDQTSLITAFYKTTVSQQYPGVSQLIFNYKNIQNSCDDITINFSQIINDAKRGLLSITWSIVSYSTPPSQETLETINQILQLANQNKYTTLKIIKYLAPVDSTLKIQVAYKFKVNQNNVQTFLVYYQMDKSIQVQQMQSIQPPFYRYMSISYTFIFSTQICNNKGPQIQSFPMNIQITPSQELQYLQNTLQSYQGQNLEIDILQYTLPSNKLSFLNVTFSLQQYPNITLTQSMPIQVLASPIFVKINGSDNMIVDYRSQLFLFGTSRDFEVEDPNTDQGISLTWSCYNLQNSTDSNCYDYKKQLVLLEQSQNNITVKSNTFVAYSTLRFTFSGKKDTRPSQNSSVICIFAELNLPPLQVGMNYQTTFNLNEDIFAILQYNKKYSSDLLSFAGALLYNNEVVGALKFDFYKVRFRIWDYFSDLKPGQNALQVRFSVYNPYFVMPSISTLEINVNFPPSNCQFTVSPQTGFSLQQVFTLSMDNCQDENQPLSYQFFYYNSLDEYQQEIEQPWNILRRQIQEQSYSNTFQTILPSGNLTLMAQALDSKLGVANTTLSITILPFSSDPSDITTFVNQQLQQIKQLPNSQQAVNLNIIAEDISKNNQTQYLESFNSLKQAILAQQFQLQQLLPNTSLLVTFTNKAAAQLQQSIIYQSSSQSSLLNQINQNLQNQMSKINGNKINKLQQDNNLVMQSLVDSFKILNATSLNSSSITDQVYQINLSNQIGEMIINSTMIENQGSIYLQGKEQTVIVDRITEKNLGQYAKPQSFSNSNQTKSFSIVYSTISQNIYYNTTSFQDYANQIKKIYPNITVSNNQVISPQIKSITNQNMLNESMFFFQFNNSKTNKNINMTCIQNLDGQWQSSQCQSKRYKLSNDYSCVCQNQSPTTLIESLEDVLLKNQNLNTAFGAQGLENIQNFTEPYKYIAFWLLAITALLQLILWYFGRKLDQKSQQRKLFLISPETQIQTIQRQSIEQINLLSPNRLCKLEQDKNYDYSQQKKNEQKEQSINQMEKIDNSPSTKQQIELKQVAAQEKNLERDNVLFTQQFSSDNDALNKKENMNLPKCIEKDLKPLPNQQQGGFSEKIKEKQILETDKLPIYSSSDQGFISQQNENPAKNQVDEENSQKIQQNNQNQIEKREDYKKFSKKNFLVRMMILHDFFSIFFVYDEKLSRPLRFQIIYLQVIHSLAMSVLFCDFTLLIQRIFISIISLIIIKIALFFSIFLYKKKGILMIISTISKILILLFYYYIIISVVSGSEPSQANQFLELFLIATGINFVIYQCLMAFIKNILIFKYISPNTTSCLILYIFDKLRLQDIIENI